MAGGKVHPGGSLRLGVQCPISIRPSTEKVQRSLHWVETKAGVHSSCFFLHPKTYVTNFRNLLFAPGLNNTYLCFQVEKLKYNSLKPCYQGVFRNQPSYLPHIFLEEPRHAEQCFLSWFDDKYPCLHAGYRVTWYMSWSPCFECAEEVVSFLGEHENVSLSISASRLYKCDDEDQQEGLRLLDQAGAEVAMMCPEDFEYCWDNFVDNGGRSFPYWKGIRRNYYALDDKLQEILQG